jgi:large subunit ribosomal protein L10
MPRPEKEQFVSELIDKLTTAKSIFLTDYSGLNVEDMNRLRRNFRQSSVEYEVVKNTLARLAVKKAGMDDLLDQIIGPTAIAYGMDDPAAPVRIIMDFAKDKNKPQVKACIFEGEVFDATRIGELANLASRGELLAKVLAGFKSPITGFVFTLQGLIRNIVGVLKAIEEKKSNEA